MADDNDSNQLSPAMTATGNFANGHGHHTRSQGLPPYSEMDPLFIAHHENFETNGKNMVDSLCKRCYLLTDLFTQAILRPNGSQTW